MTDYKKLLNQVLLKKAKGYVTKEKTEEYAVVDGEMTLTKRKVVTKHVAPDATALKILLQMEELPDVTQMTDEQLQVEKMRLIKLLADNEPALSQQAENGV